MLAPSDWDSDLESTTAENDIDFLAEVATTT